MNHPMNPATLMEGVRVTLHQAAGYGRWHCHIVPPHGWNHYLIAAGIHFVDGSPRVWCSASGDTEDECRANVADILGKLYAERLKAVWQPYTPRVETIPAPKEITL